MLNQLNRQFHLLKCSLTFWKEALRLPAPQTWDDGSNTVIDESPYHKLRLFRAKGLKRHKECIFLYPPHAGRHPNITNNLIHACQDDGFDVYVFEILAATWFTKDLDLEGLTRLGAKCYSLIKRKKILIGVCQGVWLSILVANRIEDKPVAQFVFAGPVDFWAGNGFIKKKCELIPPEFMDIAAFMSGGLQSGSTQWWNFTSGDLKAVFYDDYAKLWDLIIAGKDISEWINNHGWYYSPQHLSQWFFQATKWLFIENRLKDMVDFKKFGWPLRIFVGGKDAITPPEQTLAMQNWVSSNNVKAYIFKKCGHTASFCKPEPLAQMIEDLRLISPAKEIKCNAYRAAGNHKRMAA
ncbi:MAG: alpha/beta hydrolase [Patescibacteria group bacterium]|nr:alpha/beta hydrolase [Patescibacteria group bacterium]